MIKELVIRAANETYDEPLVIPVSIPNGDQISRLAFSLHSQGKPYTGRALGWDVYYRPFKHGAPVGSSLSFTPACFIIGESSIWSVSFDWENGNEAPPLITTAGKIGQAMPV